MWSISKLNKNFLGGILMKKIVNLFVVVGFIISIANFAFAEQTYRLENVVIFSRHNVRSPTVSGSKILTQVTNRKWIKWSGNAGELSTRGGLLETAMGEYFRKYLEHENFLTANYVPAENEFKFYANSRNRTVSTAKFFASGLLPVADVNIEHKYPVETNNDEIFFTKMNDVDENFREKILAEAAKQNNVKTFGEVGEKLEPSVRLIEKIIDFKTSPYAKEKNISTLPTDDFNLTLETNKTIKSSGGIEIAHNVVDGLLMQFYEEPFTYQKSFGRKISDKEFEQMMTLHRSVVTTVFGNPLSAPVICQPTLKFLSEEIAADRKFTFICGHDSNMTAMLTTLEVENFSFPNTYEKIPIGAKFVIEKRLGDDGKEYAKIYLLYQKFDQIKNLDVLSLENPPQTFDLKFKGLQANEDGLYLYGDFVKHLNGKIQ